MASQTKTIRINYKPSEKQQEFHDLVEKTRFTAFIGGVRSGKTKAGVQQDIKQSVLLPGSFGLIAAPTYKMLEDVTMREYFEVCPRDLIRDFNKSSKHVWLVNDSETIFRSTEHPDVLRGTGLSRFFLDEAALMPEIVWKIMIARLSEAGDQARGWIGTTPGFHAWVQDRFATGRKDYAMVQASIFDNPTLSKAYIESIIGDYTGAFYEREALGKFVKFEGLIWPDLDTTTHQLERHPDEFKRYIAGVDWGFTHPFVIAVAGVDGDGRYHFFTQCYQTHLDPNEQIAQAQELARRYPIETFWCGRDEPGNIEAWRKAGLNAQPAVTDVIPGIQSVAAAVKIRDDGKPGCTFSTAVPNVLADCLGYQWKQGKDGEAKKDEPLKVKDDGADAVRYAVHSDKTEGDQRVELILLGGADDDELD